MTDSNTEVLTKVVQLGKRRAPLHQMAKEWLFQEKKSYASLQQTLGEQLTPVEHLEALLAVLANQYELNQAPWLAKGAKWENPPLLALAPTVSAVRASKDKEKAAPLLLSSLQARLPRLLVKKPRQKTPTPDEADTALLAELVTITNELPDSLVPLLSCEQLESFLRVMRALPIARAEKLFTTCIKQEVERAHKIWGPWPFGLRREVQQLATLLEVHPSLSMARALLYAARLSGTKSGAEVAVLAYQEKIKKLAESYQELRTLAPEELTFPQALAALEKF
jgi:hypothetical protein